MYEPEVTIITPTNNIIDEGKADDFTLLVNLLNRQTYPYIEHIIVDNASTDETTAFLKEYKNAGYIDFLSAPDTGKYDAINKGIMRAKGKYIGILSCDDFYHDIMAIEELVSAMEEENADYACCNSYCIQNDGNVLKFQPAIFNVFQVVPCAHQAMFYKKTALQQMGYFDTKFKILSDYDMIIRLVMARLNGIIYDGNIVTYKNSEQAYKHPSQVDAECSHIFHKNYSALYPLNEEELDRMVKISEIPQTLLDKLSEFFPQSKQEFYNSYVNMYNLRLEVAQAVRDAEKNR